MNWDLLAWALNARRRFLDVSLREMARQAGMGMTPSTLSRAMNGKPVDPVTMINLCRYLGLSVDSFRVELAEGGIVVSEYAKQQLDEILKNDQEASCT